MVSVLSRSVQGLGGPAAAADVQGELCEPRKSAQRVGHHSSQDHRRLVDHGWICKSYWTQRENNFNMNTVQSDQVIVTFTFLFAQVMNKDSTVLFSSPGFGRA